MQKAANTSTILKFVKIITWSWIPAFYKKSKQTEWWENDAGWLELIDSSF